MPCALLVIILKFVQEQTGTAAVSLLGKMILVCGNSFVFNYFLYKLMLGHESQTTSHSSSHLEPQCLLCALLYTCYLKCKCRALFLVQTFSCVGACAPDSVTEI